MEYKTDIGGQGQRKSGQLCLVHIRPDRQTTDRGFLKIRTKSGQRTESRQTDTGQRIRTADRHRTGFSGKSGQKRDTDSRRLVSGLITGIPRNPGSYQSQ